MIFSIVSICLLPLVTARVWEVQVGGADLLFNPEAIAADPGDQVVFHFYPKNHTVSQSSFANPCSLRTGGFDSGFMPVAPNATAHPTFTVPVENRDAIWVHCRQAGNTPNSHCGKGMVFAINCGQDGAPNSFTNFKNAALAIGASLAGTTPTSTYAYAPTAAPSGSQVTATITLASSTWTTTYTSYPGSPDPTPSSLTGNIIKVVVGGPGKLAFDPPHVPAKPRDIVRFEFHVKNHTVTQSSFGAPCVRLTSDNVTGFDSGFQPVAADATSFPTWDLLINDTAPIWAYCRQGNHCASGMVFAVNPVENSPRNYSAFQALAMSLNGSASASPLPSPTASSGATTLTVGAGFTLAFGALLAILL